MRTELITRLRVEATYVREDLTKLAQRLSGWNTPGARSRIALLVGVAAIVYGVAQWSEPLAWVLVGVSALIYGAVLVDLDEMPSRRRRG